MNDNVNLNKAKSRKNDEYYTQYNDIEKEMLNYNLTDKIIYCNTDDKSSNFYKYFKDNYKKHKLKGLYISSLNKELVYYNGIEETHTYLNNGSYDSEELKSVLDLSNIVITNPPFSKWRNYFDFLIKNNKDFIILGTLLNVSTKNVFKHFVNNKVRLGKSIYKGSTFFINDNELKLLTNARWFTSLDVTGKMKISLSKNYNEAEYLKYDNHNIINVDRSKDIPIDYDGYMGVPLNYLDYFDYSLFNLIGIDRYTDLNKEYGKRFKVGGKEKFARIIIKRKTLK